MVHRRRPSVAAALRHSAGTATLAATFARMTRTRQAPCSMLALVGGTADSMRNLARLFPFIAHVFPLHAATAIVESGQLLSADDRFARKLQIVRSSSSEIDRVLGFNRFVHFYLVDSLDMATARGVQNLAGRARLLESKLLAARPFPHGVLIIPTATIDPNAAWISCWNIGRGKPGVGQWMGDSPADCLCHWRRFREKHRGARKALKGFVTQDIEVPLFRPSDVSTNESIIRSEGAELLLRSPLNLPARTTFWLFSRLDMASVGRHIRDLRGLQSVRTATLRGYSDAPNDPAPDHVRKAIDESVRHPERGVPQLEFD
jgi:hypothetical protein